MRRLIQHGRAHPYLTGGILLTTTLGALSSVCANRQIVINTSPSVAPGLYVRSNDLPTVGALVDFPIPSAAADYVRTRTGGRSGGARWYILKPIVAGPGDDVDCTGNWLAINGRRIATMPPWGDSQGDRLPVWRGHRRLETDEFFVFSARIPNSFDSRCYGPIRRREIAAVRKPLLTW